MDRPPKGDPRRSIYLAVVSMRLMGYFLVAGSPMSCLFGGIFLWTVGRRFGPLFFGLNVFQFFPLYIGIGVMYLLAARFLRQRRRWAITVGLAAVFMQLFAILFVPAFRLYDIWIYWMADRGVPKPDPILLLGYAAIFTALGYLARQLVRSISALRLPPFSGQSGFDVIRPANPAE